MEASRKVQEEAEHEISVIEEKLSQITGSQAEFSKKREGISQRMQELRMGLLSLEKDKSSLEAEIASMESRRRGEAGRITQLEETKEWGTAKGDCPVPDPGSEAERTSRRSGEVH